MLIITMPHQNRPADPSRSSTNHHHPRFRSNRARVTQPSHVPASMCTLLETGDVSMVDGPSGTRMGRFRKSSGGQTDHHQEVEGTFQKLSVHRAFPLETMAVKMIRPPEAGYQSNTVIFEPQSLNRTRDPLLRT